MAEQSAIAASINEAGGITSLSLPEWSESLIKAFSPAKRRTPPRLLCVGGRRTSEGEQMRREVVFNIFWLEHPEERGVAGGVGQN